MSSNVFLFIWIISTKSQPSFTINPYSTQHYFTPHNDWLKHSGLVEDITGFNYCFDNLIGTMLFKLSRDFYCCIIIVLAIGRFNIINGPVRLCSISTAGLWRGPLIALSSPIIYGRLFTDIIPWCLCPNANSWAEVDCLSPVKVKVKTWNGCWWSHINRQFLIQILRSPLLVINRISI